jgi:DNA-binding GntR family transcriptional regulator
MLVERKSIRERVRDLILERIATRELQPNDRILEVKLAQELGVSAIPVREAIRELVAIGVLEAITHKGAKVREIGTIDTICALQVKSVLEPLAVHLAGERLRPRIAELRDAAERILAAAQAADFALYREHNDKFHRTIVEASGNRILVKLWDSLALEVRAQSIMEYVKTTDPIEIARDHSMVINAIEAGELAAAASLLSSHCWHLIGYLRRQMEAHCNPDQCGHALEGGSVAATLNSHL